MKNKHPLRVVLDTNVLLVSISDRSRFHWLYKALLNAEFELYVTGEILLEYEEIISARWSGEAAQATMRTLMELSNVHFATIYFNLNLIEDDADDNKFVDCAFSSNAHYLVSNDRHFSILKTVPFPNINVVRVEEFEELLNKMRT